MVTVLAEPILTCPVSLERFFGAKAEQLQERVKELMRASLSRDFDASLRAGYEALKETSNDFEEALVRCLLAFCLLAKNQLREAEAQIALAEQGARLAPDEAGLQAVVLLTRCALCSAKGDLAASKRAYRKAARLVVNSAAQPALHAVLLGFEGGLFAQEGHWGEAAERWHKAQELTSALQRDELVLYVEALRELINQAYQHLAEQAWQEKPSVEAEMRYVSEHRQELEQKYPGQWLAIAGDRLVAHGRSLKRVMERARKQGVKDPLIIGTRARRYQRSAIVV